MFYQTGSTTSFGLNTLTGNRDKIRIDIRQIAQRNIRITGIIESGIFTRQPFKGSMSTNMHYRISLPDIAQPVIETQIMMRGSAERREINVAWIFTKTTRRLHCNKYISVHCSGNK